MSPKDNNKQVSAAVRILQQKRDASARATHLMVKNDPLITYEKAFLGQAAIKKFFIATFLERKIMSTKTSIKRIALVAAAALALGGFSAVSANAADNAQIKFYQGDGTTAGAAVAPYATGAGVAGTANSVKIQLIPSATAKDQVLTITGGTFGSADTTTVVIAAGAASASRAGTWTNNAIITIPTPTVGTITVNLYNGSNGVFSTTVAESVVITVSAAASSGVYSAAKSTVFLAAGETSTAVAVDAVVSKPATAAADNDTLTAAGTIQVSYKDALGAAMAAESITATIISGPGTVATTAAGVTSDSTTVIDSTSGSAAAIAAGLIKNKVNQYSVAAQLSTAGWANFVVFPNGQTGTSVIVIKNAAGTEIGRKSILFTGTTIATIEATVVKAFVDGDAAASPASAYGAIKVVVKDSAGNPISGATAPTPTSSSTYLTVENSSDGIDTATSDTSGVIYYRAKSTLAKTYGPATITFTSGTVTKTAVLTWSSKKAATFTITGPGNAGTGDALSFSATAKDALGYAIPDGLVASTYIASSVTSAGIGSPALTGKFAAGVATLAATGATVSAASATVTFTLTGTLASTTDTNFASTLVGTDIAVPLTLESPTDATASLALDAANAATDAANNAYDEAQNATQAASDALAAVTALAKQVKSLIASVKRLTAAVAKLK